VRALYAGAPHCIDSSAVKPSRAPYPVVDLFAGPGGLGEGFASAPGPADEPRFRTAVSIERDPFAHLTLLLRHFVRSFPDGDIPDDYYAFLSERITREELFERNPEAAEHARLSALRISLGPESHRRVGEAIRHRLGKSARWALVGGPPCQAYSLAGRSRMASQPGFGTDERHTLYLEYLRILADHRPPIFVMENVKGLLSATIDGRSAINRIVADLSKPSGALHTAPEDLTYRLFSLVHDDAVGEDVDPRMFVVRAEEHGIPQARHRMFIVGIRSDLEVRPGTLKRIAAPTVRDTIGSLPAIRSGLSKQPDSADLWAAELRRISSLKLHAQLNGAPYARELARALSFGELIEIKHPHARTSTRYTMRRPNHPVLRSLYDDRLSALTGHEGRTHMASDLRRYLYAAVFADKTGRSPKLADFPADLLPGHRNVDLGCSGKMFSDRFRVQLPDRVSTTVTSHISKDGHYFIHYDPAQCRSLTVREAARLQTFPDNYFFAGPRTEQYHQVGNAVPPQLAVQIAGIVGDVLDAMGPEE
jgi:DNA (cytosine-5)-methyltransferase 1